MNTLQSIYENKLVAVIRGAREEEIVSIAKALREGGINILEITAETPNVLPLIERLSSEFGSEVTVGAGTVLDSETARAAIMAGAEFLFSPTGNAATIQLSKRYGGVSIPGAMTPTGGLMAYEQGADLVKLFSANIMGPRYLKDVHGPLPHIPLMPTGGVNLDNIEEYFQNGAVAVGLGSALINMNQPINETTLREITKKASQFMKKIKSY
ncbi:bifunctional 4-hydroxy-2-oxoglutarate aldolase/2-dehydro-3-deoxy-phosphogluconate aldolase [Virgibacillus doumboii]|uniref:bifunctional 4-hydroxy-2-oxoglutarate aldolase/2-dehydro-3-deoxy-phosphogluconate aldolase n=1 Tax=Virgibacillus doumboii TaxID=2697503 RepID=UPI0013E0C567|nr:bifunctional 4-hydroxy-2-oxoglutarate aldolase/2-dehydro-3-deoxy-phosphogluconate aldolase [Virgibacillus doumboii]